MAFKPETLRLFIGMSFSGMGILLFNTMQKASLKPSLMTIEFIFSVLGFITLLINLLRKGG